MLDEAKQQTSQTSSRSEHYPELIAQFEDNFEKFTDLKKKYQSSINDLEQRDIPKNMREHINQFKDEIKGFFDQKEKDYDRDISDSNLRIQRNKLRGLGNELDVILKNNISPQHEDYPNHVVKVEEKFQEVVAAKEQMETTIEKLEKLGIDEKYQNDCKILQKESTEQVRSCLDRLVTMYQPQVQSLVKELRKFLTRQQNMRKILKHLLI